MRFGKDIARPRFAPLLLVVASTSLTVVGLEGAARIVRRWEGRGKEAAEVLQYTEYEPILGWRKKPGARAIYRRCEYTVEVTVNSQGLRDPERSHAAPKGKLRLLALGDSFVEGYSVPLAQTVSQVLESALTHRGQLYSPRIVLDYFGTPKPVFEMGEDRLCVHRLPVRESPPRASAADAPEVEDTGPVEACGARLLVIYVPSRLEVDDRSWRLSRHLYGWDESGWDRARVAERLEQIGEQARFPVLDLTDSLRRASESWGPRPYFTYDGHWTALGHRLAAEGVERFLDAHGWLGQCAAAERR